MLKIILPSMRSILPFNERARDLRLQNKPLWLYQRDVLYPYITREMELGQDDPLPEIHEPCLVYRDNLFFDSYYIKEFLNIARKRNKPSRAAFSTKNPAFREHCLPLSVSYTKASEELYLADLWYYPEGTCPQGFFPQDYHQQNNNGNGSKPSAPNEEAEPLDVDMQVREMGYYHIPTYMAFEQGDLVYEVPLRSLIAIDTWVHVFIADMVFGLFGRGAHFENRLKNDPFFKLDVLGRGMWEGKQVLQCSGLVKIGKDCVIDPSAIIHGPTTIGDHVTIGAGAIIDNCIIGSNANISQGCQLMLCVIGDGTFLPFRASLFMTTLMDNAMVAQNTCLQMCVVGRNSFIGAGSTFTDFNLLSGPIKARDGNGELKFSNRPVLGGCVGHNCRIGAGMIIYPARMIESDVVVVASPTRRVIDKDVSFEESDHHHLPAAYLHQRLYPRPGESVKESW